MKNKGFSLVELIIVIAIMAILAAAIAPALIRYIDKSRSANEDIYDEIQSNSGFPTTGSTTAVTASAGGTFQAASGMSYPLLVAEMNSSAGGTAPKIKYKKNGATGWAVGFNANGKPVVWITGSSLHVELQPDIDSTYK